MSGVCRFAIEDDENETDNSVTECLEAIGVLAPKRKTTPPLVYKLGEVIANGVRYFGQEKCVKGNRTAMCICPRCGELFRTRVAIVKAGNTKSCGCKK